MTWNFAVGCAIGGMAAAVVVAIVRIVKYFVAFYRVFESVDRRPLRRGYGDAIVTPPDSNDRGGPKSGSAKSAQRYHRAE